MRSISKKFPGFDHIYLINSGDSQRDFFGDIELWGEDKFAVLRGETRPKQAAQVRWNSGFSRPSDVIWTSRAVPFVFSSQVLSLLNEAGITGWSTYATEVFDKAGSVIPGYSGIAVDGRCGEIDNNRSELVNRVYPGGTFPVHKGLYFEESCWDGTDIFTTDRISGFVFATESVKDVFEKAGVRNIEFQKSNEFERASL